MTALAPSEPASACTYGVVRERKVAITGLAIRASCRCFRISRVPVLRRGRRNTSAPAHPEPDGEPKPECVDYRLAGGGEQLTKGVLNHGGNLCKLLKWCVLLVRQNRLPSGSSGCRSVPWADGFGPKISRGGDRRPPQTFWGVVGCQ